MCFPDIPIHLQREPLEVNLLMDYCSLFGLNTANLGLLQPTIGIFSSYRWVCLKMRYISKLWLV